MDVDEKNTNQAGAESERASPARKKPISIGFLEGQFSVPDDLDTMMAEEIEEMFYGPLSSKDEP
jgi:hypothetical protein